MLREPKGQAPLLARDEAPTGLEQPVHDQDGEALPPITVGLSLHAQAHDLEDLEEVPVLGLDLLLNDLEPALARVVLDVLDDLLVLVLFPRGIVVPGPPRSVLRPSGDVVERRGESARREGPHDDKDEKPRAGRVGDELEEEESDAGGDGWGGDRARAGGRGERPEGAEGGVREGVGTWARTGGG